jgi:hypothetical protein
MTGDFNSSDERCRVQHPQPTADDADVSYDPEAGVYRANHEWNVGQPISTTVVYALAAALGVDPLDLDPLYRFIDPDALDALFRPPSLFQGRNAVSVAFEVNGYAVTVDDTGRITVRSQVTDCGRGIDDSEAGGRS